MIAESGQGEPPHFGDTHIDEGLKVRHAEGARGLDAAGVHPQKSTAKGLCSIGSDDQRDCDGARPERGDIQKFDLWVENLCNRRQGYGRPKVEQQNDQNFRRTAKHDCVAVRQFLGDDTVGKFCCRPDQAENDHED